MVSIHKKYVKPQRYMFKKDRRDRHLLQHLVILPQLNVLLKKHTALSFPMIATTLLLYLLYDATHILSLANNHCNHYDLKILTLEIDFLTYEPCYMTYT